MLTGFGLESFDVRFSMFIADRARIFFTMHRSLSDVSLFSDKPRSGEEARKAEQPPTKTRRRPQKAATRKVRL